MKASTAAALAFASGVCVLFVLACGESRSPIGDECIRGDDCLSGVCSARLCVAAPPLVTGTSSPTPAETVTLPEADAAAAEDASPTDAHEDG